MIEGGIDDHDVSLCQDDIEEIPMEDIPGAEESKTTETKEILKTSTKAPKESNIKTFLRIRPSRKDKIYFHKDDLKDNILHFKIPLSELKPNDTYVNNSRTSFAFAFDDILGMDVKQDEVFDTVGRSSVRNALEGYNSTIFAYGQTGSGKTFTITGGAEKYTDRGIIPRSLTMIFNEIKNRSDFQYSIYISYYQIYNEMGYDLLDESNEAKPLDQLPRIQLLEDGDGNIHLKNLSMHLATNEEDALNYLFLGDVNRAYASTVMNETSTRSHCIFTVALEARKIGSDKVLRSKLNLVDLAGSERVTKTKSDGQILTEAKFINSSLFFLEMVIVALREKETIGRTHVPYRNSMLTSVLRDSLGGNCKTVMIATINAEHDQTDESISTCRFAQRVAQIKNEAIINEDLDPSLLIKRLKEEIISLKEEIAFLKNERGEGEELSQEECINLKTACVDFLHTREEGATFNIGLMTLTRLRKAFEFFRQLYIEKDGGEGALMAAGVDEEAIENRPPNQADMNEEVDRLRKAIKQRDTEIEILVEMVKRHGGLPDDLSKLNEKKFTTNVSKSSQENGASSNTAPSSKARHPLLEQVPLPDVNILEDPQLSFEHFSHRYSGMKAINENKSILRKKYEEAKEAGNYVQSSRDSIDYLKKTIEEIRKERALESIRSIAKESQGNNADGDFSAEEDEQRRAIEKEKGIYMDQFQKLQGLKKEIESIKRILERNRLKMQQDFDQWYNLALKEVQNGFSHQSSIVESSERPKPSRAWASSEIPKTGDAETDADIQAYFDAKREFQRRSFGSVPTHD